MWNHPGLVDVLDIDGLLDALAARQPAPGSGSAAALVGAIAAALCAKVARFSGDEGAVAQAEALRRRLVVLAREDAEAFVVALRTLDEPRDADPETRDWKLGRSLAAAADAPLKIAEKCADVAALGADLARRGKPDLQVDAHNAATLAEAAARTAAKLVEVNLGATPDDSRVREAYRSADAAAAAAEGG